MKTASVGPVIELVQFRAAVYLLIDRRYIDSAREASATKLGTVALRDNRIVATVPSVLVNQRRITAGVEKAAKALSADVVRIRYDIGSDWTENPAVFFRIILT